MVMSGSELSNSSGVKIKPYNVESDSLSGAYADMSDGTMLTIYAQNASDNPKKGRMSWATIYRLNVEWGYMILDVSDGTHYNRELTNGSWGVWAQNF